MSYIPRRKVAGSSPRARGAPHRLDWRYTMQGIIPACAGSTACHTYRGGRQRDHPRVRGEHVSGETIRALATGSSPRARGAQSGLEILRRRPGIIPACAGSTWCCVQSEYDTGDHPRVRGEHAWTYRKSVSSPGSSPRARGAQSRFGRVQEHYGDHPRVRGEHCSTEIRIPSAGGSSPRARGAPHACGRGPPTPGIIPACAGSTRHTRS